MRAGNELTDEDRLPWLRTLAGLLEQHVKEDSLCVVACSCLKVIYRQILSGEQESRDHAADIAFVSLFNFLGFRAICDRCHKFAHA